MLRISLYGLSVICAFLVVAVDCWGNNVGLFSGTRVSAHQSMYSGEKGKSFAETATGLGGGVTVFMDGSDEVTASFNYYSASAEAGL